MCGEMGKTSRLKTKQTSADFESSQVFSWSQRAMSLQLLAPMSPPGPRQSSHGSPSIPAVSDLVDRSPRGPHGRSEDVGELLDQGKSLC